MSGKPNVPEWRQSEELSQIESQLFADGFTLGDERMLSVVATCRRQNRNVLELLTACCAARLDGSDAPSLLPRQAVMAAA